MDSHTFHVFFCFSPTVHMFRLNLFTCWYAHDTRSSAMRCPTCKHWKCFTDEQLQFTAVLVAVFLSFFLFRVFFWFWFCLFCVCCHHFTNSQLYKLSLERFSPLCIPCDCNCAPIHGRYSGENVLAAWVSFNWIIVTHLYACAIRQNDRTIPNKLWKQ